MALIEAFAHVAIVQPCSTLVWWRSSTLLPVWLYFEPSSIIPMALSKFLLTWPSSSRPRLYPWRPLTFLLAPLGPRPGYFKVCWPRQDMTLAPARRGHRPFRKGILLLFVALRAFRGGIRLLFEAFVIPMAPIDIFSRVPLIRTILDHTHGARRHFCPYGSASNQPRSYPWRSSRFLLIWPSSNRPRSYPRRPLTFLLASLGQAIPVAPAKVSHRDFRH